MITEQYKNEYKLIEGMIFNLHRAFEGEGGGSEIEAVTRLLLAPRNDLLLDGCEGGAEILETRGTGEP